MAVAAVQPDPGCLQLHHSFNTGQDEVLSVVVRPKLNILTGHESNVRIWSSDTLFKSVCLKESLIPPVKGSVNCICLFPHTTALAFSVDNHILIYQYNIIGDEIGSLSLKEQYCFSQEEINQIDVHSKESFISSCDDSGEVKVIDLKNNKLHCTLSRFHNSICSSVKFSARKPWELLSGGLDCAVARWDFSRGRLLASVSTRESSSDAACMVNPAMVHSLDVFSKHHSVVCGLGDGRLALYSLKSPRRMELVFETQAHRSSIACVCCIEVETKGSFVVSVGNDREVHIYRLCDKLVLVAEKMLISKVNWVDVCYTDDTVLVFTANVVGSISIFIFKV